MNLLSYSTLLRVAAAACLVQAVGCSDSEEDDPLAFVDVNLPLGGQCEVILDDDHGLPTGLYDINTGSGFCARDYETHLRVNSLLPPKHMGRSQGNILQVHLAEVTLKGEDGKLIAFSDGDSRLPNPFEQITGVSLFPSPNEEPSIASITIQTIPATYTQSLTDFVGQTVVADIKLFGTTTGDVDVDFEPFSYPIELCDGCLTVCPSESTEDTAPSGVCDDNAGQDGRVCYDTGRVCHPCEAADEGAVCGCAPDAQGITTCTSGGLACDCSGGEGDLRCMDSALAIRGCTAGELGPACCTTDNDIRVDAALQAGRCGVDLTPTGIPVCVEKDQPGEIDPSCPDMVSFIDTHPGCCGSRGRCAADLGPELGCVSIEQSTPGVEPLVPCEYTGLPDAGGP